MIDLFPSVPAFLRALALAVSAIPTIFIPVKSFSSFTDCYSCICICNSACFSCILIRLSVCLSDECKLISALALSVSGSQKLSLQLQVMWVRQSSWLANANDDDDDDDDVDDYHHAVLSSICCSLNHVLSVYVCAMVRL